MKSGGGGEEGGVCQETAAEIDTAVLIVEIKFLYMSKWIEVSCWYYSSTSSPILTGNIAPPLARPSLVL